MSISYPINVMFIATDNCYVILNLDVTDGHPFFAEWQTVSVLQRIAILTVVMSVTDNNADS